jgi:hypothetical protein
MTTLPPCGREQTFRQIRWVSRVLSCRGMPGWLTEQHIRVLTRTLRDHVPEADWQMLDDARQQLIEQRQAVLSDADFQARAEDFAEQVGLGGRPLAIGSGRILLAAAADQKITSAQR